jgi:hypothetical protein
MNPDEIPCGDDQIVFNAASVDGIKSVMEFFRREGGWWRLTCERLSGERRVSQNAFYHACIVRPYRDWLRESGETLSHGEAHAKLAAMFLRTTIGVGDSMVELVRSTRGLSVGDMSEYIERCRQFLGDLGVVMPEDKKP